MANSININDVPILPQPTANTKIIGVENGQWAQIPASKVGGNGVAVPNIEVRAKSGSLYFRTTNLNFSELLEMAGDCYVGLMRYKKIFRDVGFKFKKWVIIDDNTSDFLGKMPFGTQIDNFKKENYQFWSETQIKPLKLSNLLVAQTVTNNAKWIEYSFNSENISERLMYFFLKTAADTTLSDIGSFLTNNSDATVTYGVKVLGAFHKKSKSISKQSNTVFNCMIPLALVIYRNVGGVRYIGEKFPFYLDYKAMFNGTINVVNGIKFLVNNGVLQ